MCECVIVSVWLCVCVSIRNAIGKEAKRRLVVQIASFSGHGTERI